MPNLTPEQSLLGAVLLDPAVYRDTDGLVTGDDFADPRLGAVFTNIGLMLSRGLPVTPESVANRFSEWRIRGLSSAEPFVWADADVYPYAAHEYAQTVRDDSLRRGIRAITRTANDELTANEHAPADIATGIAQQAQHLIDRLDSGRLRARTLAEILDGDDTYDWIIPDLLERRDRLIVTGTEGTGKTTLCRQLAVTAAAGIHPFRFTPITPARVLVIDAENTERQWRRAVRWMTTKARDEGAIDPAEAIHIVAGNRIDLTRGPHLSEIHRLIDRYKPDILFIGPLYKLVPKAINNDDDAAPLIVALDGLRERDVALVMEAHAGKSLDGGGERDLRPRGSSALLGWPEFGFGLRPVPDDLDMVRVVKWRGDRDQRDWPRHLRRGGEWPWIPSVVPQ